MVFRIIAMFVAMSSLSFELSDTKTQIAEIISSYDNEIMEYERLAADFLDRQEASAREQGDKLLLDQRRKETDEFRQTSELPEAAPRSLRMRPLKALENLETAFEKAISSAIRSGNDEAASELEEALSAAREKAGYPSIAGLWHEGAADSGVEILVRQKANKFVATSEYSHKEYGTVRWRMSGTIHKDGTIEGRLVHTLAPPDFQDQERRARLNRMTKTIAGKATWAGGGHSFEWTIAE